MPKISVVIPVYNVEKCLGECLDSILGQTLKDIEVICVDDGSTDSSPAILAEYAARDPRVKVLKQANAGAFRAREAGVNASKGEFLYFMDADDLLELRAFEELSDLADREDLDQIVFGSSVFCDADVTAKNRKWGASLENYYSIPPDLCGKTMSGMELMNALMIRNKYYVGPPLRLIRASVVKDNEYGFPDARSRADNYFTTVFLYYSRRAAAVAGRYYKRRVRENSITTASGANERHFRNILVVIAALCDFKPFAKELLDASSAFSRFIGKLVYIASHNYAWKMPGETRLRIIEEVLSSSSPTARAQVTNAVFLAAKGLSRRPGRTIPNALRFVCRRILKMIRRGKDVDWWL